MDRTKNNVDQNIEFAFNCKRKIPKKYFCLQFEKEIRLNFKTEIAFNFMKEIPLKFNCIRLQFYE